jgi:uncharacterized protein (DUF1501 family)
LKPGRGLYKDGRLAIVQGAGYHDPSFSQFSSMAHWHTARTAAPTIWSISTRKVPCGQPAQPCPAGVRRPRDVCTLQLVGRDAAPDRAEAFVLNVRKTCANYRTPVGRGGDVAVVPFGEFRRRAIENTSRGTDHGTAARSS